MNLASLRNALPFQSLNFIDQTFPFNIILLVSVVLNAPQSLKIVGVGRVWACQLGQVTVNRSNPLVI